MKAQHGASPFSGDVTAAVQVLIAQERDVYTSLEPGVSLIWCPDHVAWHRVSTRLRVVAADDD